MSQLLHLVGGSKTIIYTYFGDKAGLFTAVVDELPEDTVAFSDSFNPQLTPYFKPPNNI